MEGDIDRDGGILKIAGQLLLNSTLERCRSMTQRSTSREELHLSNAKGIHHHTQSMSTRQWRWDDYGVTVAIRCHFLVTSRNCSSSRCNTARLAGSVVTTRSCR